jgi:hypothetical protein
MTEQATEGTARRSSPAKTAARIVIALVLIVVIFWYLLKDISLADVWAAITAMTWTELVCLAVVAGWNLVTYAFVWMTVTPGLRFGRAMLMTQATTAITNTVPAGSAIGIGMTYAMLAAGVLPLRTTIAVLVSGVWNAFAKLAIPVLALALVALQGDASAARVTAAGFGIGGLIAAIVLFALMLRSEHMAERVGVIGRPGHLPAAGPDPAAAGAGLGDRHRQVPQPHRRPAGARLVPDHRRPPWSATCRCTWCCWSACATSGSATPRSAGPRSWPCSPSPAWPPPSPSPRAGPGWWRRC